MHWTIDRPPPIQVVTDEDVRKLKEKLAHCEMVAFDTETTGLHPTKDMLLFWSLSTGDDRYFLERRHLDTMKPVLEEAGRVWIGTNTKYDAHMMANAGIQLKGDWLDTLVMDRMVDCDQIHKLKHSYEREFGEHVLEFEDVFYTVNKKGKRVKPKETIGEVLLKAWDTRPQDVIEYASLDAWMSYRLFSRLQEKLEAMTSWRGQNLWDLYLDLETPFHKVLFTMERNGMTVDVPYLERVGEQIQQEMDAQQRKLNQLVGYYTNPNSPKQMIDLFVHKRGLPVLKETGKGDPSVDEEVLKEYRKLGVPEAEVVLEMRSLKKTLGTYVVGMIEKVCPDGKIHSTFNQHVADTNRLSSSDPNLQNIPNPNKDRWDIRRAFTAQPGKSYLAGDYDQIELYIGAGHFSMDPAILRAIAEGRDLHSSNVAFLWDEPYEDVISAKKNKSAVDARSVRLRELRDYAKTIAFGLFYGQGPNRLANEMGFPDSFRAQYPNLPEKKIMWMAKDKAIELTELFFARMPRVREFIQETHRVVSEYKYIETWLGRRRWLRHVADLDFLIAHQQDAENLALYKNRDPSRAMCWCDTCKESREAQRQGTNTPVQGTAADVVQKFLNQSHNDPDLTEVDLVLQVHDEAGWEVPKEIVHDVIPRLQWHMQNPGIDDLRVPLRAGLEAADNWLEAK